MDPPRSAQSDGTPAASMLSGRALVVFLPCGSQEVETETSIQKAILESPRHFFLSMHRPTLLELKPPHPTLNRARLRKHPKLKACKPDPATKTQKN
jgi:hypothetical protein